MFFGVEFLPEYSRNKNRVAVRYKRICKYVRLIRGGRHRLRSESGVRYGYGRRYATYGAEVGVSAARKPKIKNSLIFL